MVRQRKKSFDIQIIKESTKGHEVVFRKSVRKIKGEKLGSVLFFDSLSLEKGDELFVVGTESEHVYKYKAKRNFL